MSFDLQPTLKGRLVSLRPMRFDDFDAVYEAAADPLIWEQHPEPLRYRREVFQKFLDGAMESGGAFVVIDLESSKIVGSSRFYNYSAERQEVAIGYTFLVREYWGRGYNHEMKTLMIEHAFRFVERVFFEVGTNNRRSQKALQNIGATLCGTANLSALDGTLNPHLVFEIKRPNATSRRS